MMPSRRFRRLHKQLNAFDRGHIVRMHKVFIDESRLIFEVDDHRLRPGRHRLSYKKRKGILNMLRTIVKNRIPEECITDNIADLVPKKRVAERPHLLIA
ncbi:hypothetical protein TNCV_4220931 [Trichonephila clavipes]|nr:hypothetical protein TNCV_4220931 [Trichonephila clavipes]